MPSEYPAIVLSPVAGLAANLAAHVLLSRLWRGRGQMVCLFGGIIGGLVCTTVVNLLGLLKAESAWDAFGYLSLNLVTYLGLAWCYFHFVNLSLASLRIRLMNEMAQSSGGLSEDEILRRYNAGQIIETRLARLTGGGHLVVRDGRFFPGNSAFVILFDVFEILKYAILGKRNRLLRGGANPGPAVDARGPKTRLKEL